MLGERLKRLRLARGMHQSDLAASSGVSTATISKIENNLISPTLLTLEALAKALGVSVRSLISDEGDAAREDDYEAFVRQHLPNTPAPLARTFMENLDRLETEAQEEVIRIMRLLDRARPKPRPRRGRGRAKNKGEGQSGEMAV